MSGMYRRERLEDGTLGPMKPVFPDQLLPEQKVELLGSQLAQEKLANMQKDSVINGLGAQVAQMKLEIMQLKGGDN